MVTGAGFMGSSLTKEQLYATASYQAKDLRQIRLRGYMQFSDLTGWDLSGQDLTGADLSFSNLTDVNLERANMTSADLSSSFFTGANLSDSDMTDAQLMYARLTDATLSKANLVGANLRSSLLSNTDFAGALVPDANFQDTTSRGFTPEQLYSTASYQEKNLRGIDLSQNDLTGWNFRGQDLTGAKITSASLAHTDLTDADLTNVFFSSGDDLSSAVFGNTVYNQGTRFPKGFDPESSGLTLVPSRPGDLNANDVLDIADIDMLIDRIWRHGGPLADAIYDLNDDNTVDQIDLRIWVLDLRRTRFGDVDLNGEVNFADFLVLSQHFGSSGGWSRGDFDANGRVQFPDFSLLAANFGNTSESPAFVPEPSTLPTLVVAILFLWYRVQKTTAR